VNAHRGGRNDLIDVFDLGFADNPDDDLPQQLGRNIGTPSLIGWTKYS
jgi:hypothetical protein